MLPENKAEFPKCLYLDQNFWIGLAQAAIGHAAGERYKPSLSAIQQSSDSGKLIVPLSQVHFIEASIPGREERRSKLMNFMLALSRGKRLADYKRTRPIEIENSIRRWRGMGGLRPVRPSIVGEEFAATLDVPAEQRPIIDSFIRSPSEFHSMFMAISGDRENVNQTIAREDAGVAELENIRKLGQAHLAGNQREILAYAEQFREQSVFDELSLSLEKTNVPLADWVTDIMSVPLQLLRFSEDIPFIDVHVRLMLLHGPNLSREYSGSDVRDLVWLPMALPYSNIVAGEKCWTTLAMPLARKYSTILINRPERLPAALEAEGCL